MNRWSTYILLAVIGIGTCVLFGFTQHKYASRQIKSLDINFSGEETKLITKNMVNNLLIQSIGNPLNQLNSTINLHRIESTVKQNQLIKNADVFLLPDGQLQIDVEQKNPIARLQTNDGVKYLDENGQVMPLSKYYSKRVILVDGGNSESELKDLQHIISYIHQDELLNKQIIGITKLDNGDYLLSTRVGFHKILFGKANQIEQKFTKLTLFYKKMWNNETINTYDLINLKYNKQVVCSRKTASVQS